jgi:hypothetical protein
MVSITLSVSDEIRERMGMFPEMNWSGFVRKAIEEKTKELAWKEEMLQKLNKDNDLTNWSMRLQKKARKGRFLELKRKGLV